MYRVGAAERRRQRRLTIGNARLIDLGVARERARAALRAAKEGSDPAVKVDPPRRITFREAFDNYMDLHVVPNLRARTAGDKRAMFEREVLGTWGDRPLDSIRRADVVVLIDGLVARGARVVANRVFESIRAFFNWAIARGIVSESPCYGAKRPTTEKPRERDLNEDEVRLFWRGAGEIGAPFDNLFRLLLLTAQRRDEVRCMRWREVDLGKASWTIPADRAKNGREHVVALSELALEILRSIEARQPKHGPDELIFGSHANPRNAISGLSRAKRRLDAAMTRVAGTSVRPFVLHDLRRTAVSLMAEMGIPPHVADRVLNHKSGTIRGVAAIYQRYEFGSEERDALMRWGRRVAELVYSECGIKDMELRA
ncbi:MAG: site-specific integrase [Alphaproteobacteria bacterium]|nr:site-specific integrase [Alphaproteobacteria bacterium]